MPWDIRPPWDVDRATDGRRRARRPRRSTGSRSRCTAATTTGMAELRRRVDVRVAGGELTARALRVRRAAAPRAASTCSSPTACAPRASPACAGLAADVVAAGQGLHAAHVGQRHRPARQRPPHRRHRRRAVPRVPVRPAGVDDGPPRLPRSPRPSRSTATAGSRCPTAPASASPSTRTLARTATTRHASPDRSRVVCDVRVLVTAPATIADGASTRRDQRSTGGGGG